MSSRNRTLRAGAVTIVTELPKTLANLLAEFLQQHAQENLAPKTIERYRECVAYLSRELLELPLKQITPLHLNREWKRLIASGGRTRKKQPRPMSAKTVRNVAGVVSSAFGRAVKWGLVSVNPCSASEPPKRARNQR
jgi:hypothetical protein